MTRLGVTGLISDTVELGLDVPAPGPWLIFFQTVDQGAGVSPEIQLRWAVPGGGYAATTRQITVPSGFVTTLPGAGRVLVKDPANQGPPYRASLAAAPWHPPRWGLEPQVIDIPALSTIQLPQAPFSVRGRITLMNGDLSSPPLTSGMIELPPLLPGQALVTAGANGARIAVDWEGWF